MKSNKIIKYLLITIGVLFLILFIDLARTVIFKTEPLIVISTKNDNNVKVSNSILYKTYNCNGEIYIESLTSKFECPITEKVILITQNNKDVCIDGIDYFYEDEDYRYYFSCFKSNYITITIDDKEYPLKSALNNKIITINDLEGKLQFYKESKKEDKTSNTIKLLAQNNKCSTKTEKIYTYNKTEYYYDCSSNSYLLEVNNETISISKALQSGKVTINKLKELGLKITTKELKNEEIEVKKEENIKIEKDDNTKIDTPADNNETITNSPELVFIKNNNNSQKMITIYQDNNYEYYYYTPNNGDYNIKYKDKYYTIKTAINKNIITLSSLQGLGLDYYKKKITKVDEKFDNSEIKNETKSIKLIDKSTGGNCASAIDYFYEDSHYKYYFTCMKSGSMYLLINGKEYPLKTALNNKITTIKELEENGIYFLKQSKNLVTK